jgi:hypothetical protein
MLARLVEFFEGDSGRLSMTRLLCFLSFIPASYVVLKEPSEGMLGWYLGAYVLGYVGGKGADVLMKGRNHDRVPD